MKRKLFGLLFAVVGVCALAGFASCVDGATSSSIEESSTSAIQTEENSVSVSTHEHLYNQEIANEYLRRY